VGVLTDEGNEGEGEDCCETGGKGISVMEEIMGMTWIVERSNKKKHETLPSILNFLHNKNTTEIIIYGDFNINYLNDKKSKLDNLLLSYNLYSTVNFPTRIHNNSVSAIDNIFIDKVKLKINPYIHWLTGYLIMMPKL